MGVAVGDALGLPAQFYSRKVLDKYPLVKMVESEEGTAGTYSDDTAMTLCTLASFTENNWQLDLQDIMNRFIDWYGHGYMAVNHKTIDVGKQHARQFSVLMTAYLWINAAVLTNGTAAMARLCVFLR